MGSCCKKIEKAEQQTREYNVITALLLLPIRFYRYFISPMLGPHCRFEPTCSHYAEQAIREHGALKGIALAVQRICKCHPWHKGGYDPVPKKK